MWVRELDWAGRLVWSNGRGDGRQVGELYPFRGACQVSVADPPTAPVPALPDARIVCAWHALAIATLPLPSDYPVINQPLDAGPTFMPGGPQIIRSWSPCW